MITDYAAAQVGALYVSGGQGQTATVALIKQLEKDSGDEKRALAAYNKNVVNGGSLIIYDCSGLVINYLLNIVKVISRDYNANGIFYDLCKRIEKDELIGGDLVFKKYLTSSRVHHVGIYMGDGTVVHAKGRDYGVVREAISKTSWNRFGRLKMLNEGGEIMIKDGSKGEHVAIVQRAMERLGYKGNMDSSKYGSWGPNSAAALKPLQKTLGLPQTGNVDEMTYAKIIEAVMKIDNSAEYKDQLIKLQGVNADYLSRLRSVRDIANVG